MVSVKKERVKTCVNKETQDILGTAESRIKPKITDSEIQLALNGNRLF